MVYNTNITSITTNTTLSTKDDVYLVDASGGNLTLTLPNILGNGMRYKLQRIDTSTGNSVTVQGFSGAQTIDGSTSVLLYNWTSFEVQSYNAVWYTVNNSIAHGSGAKTLFTSAFIQNNGSAFVTFAGTGTAQLVCSFFYPGSNIEQIHAVVLVIAASGGTPNGTATIQTQGGGVIASVPYNTSSTTAFVISSASITIANVPTGPSVLEYRVNHSGNSNKLNVYSLTLY